MTSRYQALVYQSQHQYWLHFENPIAIFALDRTSTDLLPTLEEIETRIEQEQCYGVGFISYEASPKFDSALTVRDDPSFPLLWFALYEHPVGILSPQDLIESYSSIPYTLGNWESEISQTQFDRAIARIKDYIARGDTFQVNYTFRLRSPFAGDGRSLFTRLLQPQSAPYSAWIDTGRYAIGSASPELFFTLDGNQLTAKPMKGTASRGTTLARDRDLAQWLHNSEKNRAENVMIVDMIRNDLGRVAETGTVSVPQLFEVECYPTLWQMTSTVTAQTRSPLSQIIANLFPCASITGAPKPRTMEIIAELETSPRRIYTGAIGLLRPGKQAQFNVAIRTVSIDRETEQAEYGIGSGIVWDSKSEEEYRECYIKSSVLTQKQPEFSLLETLLWTPRSGYFLLSYHLQRLQDSAEYFSIPVKINEIRQELSDRQITFQSQPHKIRILVDRNGKSTQEISRFSPSSPFSRVKVKLAAEPVHSANRWLYHKTTYRDVYQRARSLVGACDDVLLYNEHDEITESTIANVVIYWQGKWITPPVSSGILPGTFRAWLLEMGLIREHVITREIIARSPQPYLINSLRGWQLFELID
ncbi:aminodeoxychorismate synthase component I [Roseofilum casamattae]|uniref:Aminodeoxychorismate synthase component I n=1 Tax=Roseofilum casamattae BLCC-M143 TaxID=3022442 RepID=A0ABT7C076_9CYAN|nr:aminodeoxychorismate synthase component I [Roseofilum casamattae]MDJ1184856.1 aminodeoxychorismate synthase component I [Roseofilum casamattae BLCC-M143]